LEKKRILITDKSKNLTLHLKFYKAKANGTNDADSEDEDGRLKVKIVKKAGSLEDQYELVKELMLYLSEIIIDEEDEEQ
jgi:hypothetical protein